MQKVFSKTQGIWTLSWGLSIILLAVGALIGLDIVRLAPNITGITYLDILYLSGLLFAVGTGFGLSAARSNERQYLHRVSIIWILMVLIGIIMSLLSMTVIFTQKTLVIGSISIVYANNGWQPWFFTSLGLELYGLILFFGSMEDPTREKFWKIWPIYLVLIIIGFVCGIFSIIAMYSLTGYHSFLSITNVDWIIYGSLPMTLGLLPFAYCISSQESFKGKLDHLWFVWLIIALIGTIIYIIAASDILFNLASILKLPFQSNNYSTLLDINELGKEPELLVGLPFALVGFTFLLSTMGKNGTDHLRTLAPVWVLSVIIGLIILPLNSLAPDIFKNPTIALGLSIIFFGSAMIYKTFSLDYIPELERRPLTHAGVTTGGFEKALGISGEESVPEHATPEEKTLFLTIRKKSIENAQVQFSTAFKLGRCSETFYLAVTEKYRNEIENVRDTAKRSTRKSIFEEEIRRTEPLPATSRGVTAKGESSATEAAPSSRPASAPVSARTSATMPSPPGPPGVPPAPPSITSTASSNAPPRPPPSGSPPPPPGMTAPRPATAGPPSPPPLPTAAGGPPPPPGFSTPRPSGSPSPPPLPTGGIPPPPPGIGGTSRPMGSVSPSGPPPPPSGGMSLGTGSPVAPGTDVVGTARSTSIAELRGEMLKELRRLRDIFKEEGGPKT